MAAGEQDQLQISCHGSPKVLCRTGSARRETSCAVSWAKRHKSVNSCVACFMVRALSAPGDAALQWKILLPACSHFCFTLRFCVHVMQVGGTLNTKPFGLS